MVEEKKEEKSFFETIQPFLASVALFAALCYFLGRLYADAYYHNLGMTTNVLTFSTYDYMFFSSNLVVMCLVLSIFIYIFWWFYKSGEKINKKWLITFFFVFFLCSLYILLCIISPQYYFAGISGFIFGLIYGLYLFIMYNCGLEFALFLKSKKSAKKKKISKTYKQLLSPKTITIIISILFFLTLFSTTEILGAIQARSDIYRFPKVAVICKDELPIQLQSSSSNYTNILEGQLIITNNGITYILQPDNSVYAIPTDSIEDIKYMKK